MKASFALAMAVVALAAVPTLSTASSRDMTRHHVRYARHRLRKPTTNEAIGPSVAVAPSAPAWLPFLPAPQFELPRVAPYPPGQGDADGLSRNPEDCNKGCIDY